MLVRDERNDEVVEVDAEDVLFTEPGILARETAQQEVMVNHYATYRLNGDAMDMWACLPGSKKFFPAIPA